MTLIHDRRGRSSTGGGVKDRGLVAAVRVWYERLCNGDRRCMQTSDKENAGADVANCSLRLHT